MKYYNNPDDDEEEESDVSWQQIEEDTEALYESLETPDPDDD